MFLSSSIINNSSPAGVSAQWIRTANYSNHYKRPSTELLLYDGDWFQDTFKHLVGIHPYRVIKQSN